MNAGFDPDHHYYDLRTAYYGQGWFQQYDGGNMDGFCEMVIQGQCVQYSYVQASDVQPYMQIAKTYSFANYFFQTNEGPSFPAHLFLFSGTSAPTYPNDSNNFFLDFVAENYSSGGCLDLQPVALWVDPLGTEHSTFPQGWPGDCYTHDSLVTNVNGGKGVSWRYYLPVGGMGVWNAPGALSEICLPLIFNQQTGQWQCNGAVYTEHVVAGQSGQGQSAPILTDIQTCALKDISWVIPASVWSDHPGWGSDTPAYGPSWVGDIVDAVGQANNCDGTGYWNDTAIFIVWDDWGGFFDHVSPTPYPNEWRTTQQGCLAPNAWGCGYVYGFRVPLLVVSAYTGVYKDGTYSGYVSGACALGSCPNNVFPYVHDFGSILSFIEWNFKMQPIDQSGDNGYADYNAPDWGPLRTNIPLSDFFNLSTPRPFTSITYQYNAQFFQNYYYNHPSYTPTGPDGGPDD